MSVGETGAASDVVDGLSLMLIGCVGVCSYTIDAHRRRAARNTHHAAQPCHITSPRPTTYCIFFGQFIFSQKFNAPRGNQRNSSMHLREPRTPKTLCVRDHILHSISTESSTSTDMYRCLNPLDSRPI